MKGHVGFDLGLILSCLACLATSLAVAHPVVIDAADVPELLGVRLADVRALTPSPTGGFRGVPLQVEEFTGTGAPVYRHPTYDTKARQRFASVFEKDETPRDVLFRHRFTFDDSDFGACPEGKEKCHAAASAFLQRACAPVAKDFERSVVRVDTLAKDRSLFLVACPRHAPFPGSEPDGPAVTVDLKKRVIESDLFRYQFSEENHMLLEHFAVRPNGAADKSLSDVLFASEFHILVKPKLFFPIHLAGDDVRSELIAYDTNLLSTTGDLSFFLDVLRLKLSLRLVTHVTVYRDAIHVPMVINLPVAGTRLRHGSAVVYGFRSALADAHVSTDLPHLTDKPRAKDPSGDAKAGTESQGPRTIRLDAGGKSVALGIQIPPDLEKVGFLPSFCSKAELKNQGFPDVGTDLNVSFDLTKLSQGEHRMDLWFYLGDKADRDNLDEYARHGVRARIVRTALGRARQLGVSAKELLDAPVTPTPGTSGKP